MRRLACTCGTLDQNSSAPCPRFVQEPTEQSGGRDVLEAISQSVRKVRALRAIDCGPGKADSSPLAASAPVGRRLRRSSDPEIVEAPRLHAAADRGLQARYGLVRVALLAQEAVLVTPRGDRQACGRVRLVPDSEPQKVVERPAGGDDRAGHCDQDSERCVITT